MVGVQVVASGYPVAVGRVRVGWGLFALSEARYSWNRDRVGLRMPGVGLSGGLGA